MRESSWMTFQNSQFQQALEMIKAGAPIPPSVLVRYSNLADKEEILASIDGNQPPADPTVEARVRLLDAQTRKTDTQATDIAVKTQYSSVQTAQVIAQTPATAALADGLLRSAGAVDHDMAPIVPQPAGGLQPVALPTNTDPLTPASPARGQEAGIETLTADGVRDSTQP